MKNVSLLLYFLNEFLSINLDEVIIEKLGFKQKLKNLCEIKVRREMRKVCFLLTFLFYFPLV